MRGRPPWSLLAWLGSCCVLLVLAPAPPEPPPPTEREVTLMQRQADMVVRDARRWQRERGDRLVDWDDARGRLAIIIDDVGRELHLFEQLHALRYPLTFSILPGSIYAPGIQLRLRGDRRRYREIMLHLPMEPTNADKMSEGLEAQEQFLVGADDPATLRDKVEHALARVPAAIGVNNHMGSALTRNADAMAEVMAILRPRSLFFVDSRTIGDTRAEDVARSHGVPTLPRDVFLDHDPSPAAIEAALDEAVRRSQTEPIVAIAHPSEALVDVLRRRLPQLHAEGVGLYPVSRLVTARRAAAQRTDGPTTGTEVMAEKPTDPGPGRPRDHKASFRPEGPS
ncbi:MAG: divergent polysaccharide deacetylase family protein [Deltaproteobacteria bacterium]|nr:divergent polysaccharide deacetylase family protein [Deltaproteobacteria bacterium]